MELHSSKMWCTLPNRQARVISVSKEGALYISCAFFLFFWGILSLMHIKQRKLPFIHLLSDMQPVWLKGVCVHGGWGGFSKEAALSD